MLGWFSGKHVDEFADSIVAELLERFPPSGIELSTEKSAQKAMKNLDRILARIGAFAAERRAHGPRGDQIGQLRALLGRRA